MDLMLRAQSLLVRLISQRHATVFGQRASGVGELGALSTQVGGTHGAVHGGCVALVLITADYTLKLKKRTVSQSRLDMRVMNCKTEQNGSFRTSPMPFRASSAIPDWLVAPFWSRSKSSRRAKFFFRPQTPESPKQMYKNKNSNLKNKPIPFRTVPNCLCSTANHPVPVELCCLHDSTISWSTVCVTGLCSHEKLQFLLRTETCRCLDFVLGSWEFCPLLV